jgi:hypothetical protein
MDSLNNINESTVENGRSLQSIQAVGSSFLLDDLNTKGKALYKSNDNYRLVSNVMEHPEFREFFERFFGDKTDIMMVLVYLNLYKFVEAKLSKDATGFAKLAMVHEIMSNRDLRSSACNTVTKAFNMETTNKLLTDLS